MYLHQLISIDRLACCAKRNRYRETLTSWNTGRMREDCPASPTSSNTRTLRSYWTDSMVESMTVLNRTCLLSSYGTRIRHSIAWYCLPSPWTHHQSITAGYHRNTDVFYRSTVLMVNESLMIIVVNRLLLWVAIFRSEDRSRDEYTWITWRFRVISITFDS